VAVLSGALATAELTPTTDLYSYGKSGGGAHVADRASGERKTYRSGSNSRRYTGTTENVRPEQRTNGPLQLRVHAAARTRIRNSSGERERLITEEYRYPMGFVVECKVYDVLLAASARIRTLMTDAIPILPSC